MGFEDRFERMCNQIGGETEQIGDYSGFRCNVDPDSVRLARSSLGVDGRYLDSPFSIDFSDRSDDWRTDVMIRLNGMRIDSLPSGYDPSVDVENVEEFEFSAGKDVVEFDITGSGTFRS